MVDTAQNRTKVWIDAYWTPANITKDDAVTLATITTAYDWPDYPIARLFLDKDIDGAVSIGQASSKALVDTDHYPFCYDETVPITLCTIDKPGITGIKILGKIEEELRRIGELYPLGSLRRITGTVPKTHRLGSYFLFNIEYSLDYRRDLTSP
jgi:hypothetical protein